MANERSYVRHSTSSERNHYMIAVVALISGVCIILLTKQDNIALGLFLSLGSVQWALMNFLSNHGFFEPKGAASVRADLKRLEIAETSRDPANNAHAEEIVRKIHHFIGFYDLDLPRDMAEKIANAKKRYVGPQELNYRTCWSWRSPYDEDDF